MTMLATEARLGDSSLQFSRQYGHPGQVRARGIGVLREYVHGSQVLTVLFEQDRAIALQASYGAAPVTEQLKPADVLPPWALLTRRGRCFVGERGWLAALPDCPELALRRLLRSV